MQALLEICQRYGITVVSDEIHADLVYPGEQHTLLVMLAQAQSTSSLPSHPAKPSTSPVSAFPL